jgi:hypothetical protein
MGDCDSCQVDNMAIICHIEEERSSNAMVKWKNVFMGLNLWRKKN